MRGVYKILSVIVSIIVIIAIAKFVGVTWGDVSFFITNGLGGAFKFFNLFKGIMHAGLPDPLVRF